MSMSFIDALASDSCSNRYSGKLLRSLYICSNSVLVWSEVRSKTYAAIIPRPGLCKVEAQEVDITAAIKTEIPSMINLTICLVT